MISILISGPRRWGSIVLSVAAGALLGAGSARAENTNAPLLTLDQAVRISMTNNPGLAASGARVEAAAGRAFQAGKWSNPELELRAEDWPVSNGRGFSDAKRLVGMAQTVPYPGKKSLDRKLGTAGVTLSRAELNAHRVEVARDVKQGFYRVLAFEHLVEVAGQLAAVAESSAATAQKRVDAGAAAFQEQLRAEVQLEHARTELAGFKRDLAEARHTFATLLGQPELTNAVLASPQASAPGPGGTETSLDELIARNPATSAAKAKLSAARLAEKRARLAAYPDVTVGVAGGHMSEPNQSIIQVGFSVPLPIIDHGKGAVQEAHANVAAAEAELRAAEQQLSRDWSIARQRHQTAVEQATQYRDKILPKAEQALQLVTTGFDEGKFSFIDLVDTQRTTAEARLAYQQKLLEMNLAQVEVETLLQPGLPDSQP